MSNSKIPVTVEVADQASTVEVLDGSFRVIAQGFGRLKTELPPGVFKARSQVGAAVQEKLFAVEEGGGPQFVGLAPVAFASPAPLQDTTTSHEYHQAAVYEASSNLVPPLQVGSGSSLLLSIRDPSDTPFRQTQKSLPAYASAYQGFSLCRADGSELVNYDQAARRDIGNGFVVSKAELDPGNYILKVARHGFEPLGLPAITVPGWSTQIYLMIEAGGCGYRPALAGAALMMLPCGQNFQPADRFFRLTEVARQALQRGKNILDHNLLNDLLSSKFGNPYLGLFSAHLLLLEAAPPIPLLRTVVDNLTGLLGADFPDVIALRHRLHQLAPDSGLAPPGALEFPPLLRASWEIAAELAVDDEAIFPPGSVSRQISDRLCDNGIWMAWRPRPPQAAVSQSWRPLADDELQVKQVRDRQRIFAAFDQVAKALDSEPGQNLLQSVRQFAKPVVREKLRQFISSAASSESAGVDQLRELVVRLAKNYAWEELVEKLSELDRDGVISSRLSTTQKALIPALLMFRQQLQTGGKQAVGNWRSFIDALKLPRGVLLANLGDLARLAAGLEVQLTEDRLARFDLVFAGKQQNKKQIIDAIRNLSGVSIKDAKSYVTATTKEMKEAATRFQTEAEELKKQLE